MRIVLAWLRLDARRRWRSLFVLGLLIALATMTVLTAVAGARRGQTAFSRLWARTLPTTVTVLPNQPGFDWARIRSLPEVTALTTFAIAGFALEGYPLAGQNLGFPPGDSQVMRTIERPVVFDGRLFDPRRADEAVVTPRFLVGYGKSVGDMITLRLPTPREAANGYDPSTGTVPHGPRVPVRIVGVIRSFWFSDPPGSNGALVPSPGLLTHYRANLMGRHDSTYINALVRLRGGAAGIPAFRADLARATGRSDIDVWNNYVDFGGPVRQLSNFEAASLLAFGLAALAAAVVLIGQSVARYISATMADLQLLRGPGLRPRQAVAAAIAAPFAAAVAGTTLAVVGAIVASRWMPIGGVSTLEPEPGIDTDWLILGTGWAVVPLVVLAGSAIAAGTALAASRTRTLPRRSALALALARAGLPVSAVIGTRFALEPGRDRSAVPVRPALTGAIVGVLGVLAAFTFAAGVSDAAANPARFGQTNQLGGFLGFNGQTFNPATPKAMAAVAGDRDVIGVNDARIAVAYSGDTSVTMYSYQPVGGKRLPVVLTAGRMPATAGEVVLAPTTARQLGVTVGARIPLTSGSVPRTASVTGIGFVPEGPHNGYASGGWITLAGYDRVFNGVRYSFKFRVGEIALRSGADVQSAARRLNAVAARAAGGHGLSLTPPPPPDEVKEIRDVAALPIALGGFLALLAAGAVGHALATAVRRRRHELAVLRALGMTRRQARLVIVTQASVLTLTGLAFGVPLGLAAGRALWRVVADSTPLAYHPPLALLALVLIAPAGLLVANLLAAWPGQRAAGLPSGQVLRTE